MIYVCVRLFVCVFVCSRTAPSTDCRRRSLLHVASMSPASAWISTPLGASMYRDRVGDSSLEREREGRQGRSDDYRWQGRSDDHRWQGELKRSQMTGELRRLQMTGELRQSQKTGEIRRSQMKRGDLTITDDRGAQTITDNGRAQTITDDRGDQTITDDDCLALVQVSTLVLYWIKNT